MGCLPCLPSTKKTPSLPPPNSEIPKASAYGAGNRTGTEKQNNPAKRKDTLTEGAERISAKVFSFHELAAATQNFRPECLLGEGGFGRVYKGTLETGQIVAVKQLDRNGLQGNREFLVEVLMLSLVHHRNLVNLIGYCADGDQRLLVYEYMPNGSLEDHLHDIPLDKEPLDWNTRMKIGAGAALGLEHLHEKANPPVIYRDLKSSNILLDDKFHPKLSDFGLAKLGPVGDKSHVSTRVMGTYGYCAPEYAMTGQLTLKSDVYSFGVVMLELISGRKAVDCTKHPSEQNLVCWARPMFKDRKKFPLIADPLLRGRYPVRGLYQAIAIAAMCLQEQASTRPLMRDVVTALSYLSSQTYDPMHRSVSGSRSGENLKEKRQKKSSDADNIRSFKTGQINRGCFDETPFLEDVERSNSEILRNNVAAEAVLENAVDDSLKDGDCTYLGRENGQKFSLACSPQAEGLVFTEAKWNIRSGSQTGKI